MINAPGSALNAARAPRKRGTPVPAERLVLRTVARINRHRSRHSQVPGPMDSIIYLIGLVVVIMFILSFLGLR